MGGKGSVGVDDSGVNGGVVLSPWTDNRRSGNNASNPAIPSGSSWRAALSRLTRRRGMEKIHEQLEPEEAAKQGAHRNKDQKKDFLWGEALSAAPQCPKKRHQSSALM